MKLTKPTVAPLLVVASILHAGISRPTFADPTAHFELRLAPGYENSVLVLGNPAQDTLELEVWVEVSDVDPGVFAQLLSEFLNISQGDVITYNHDYHSDVFSFGCVEAGPDNTPNSGDFGVACTEPMGTTAGFSEPASYGAFTVSAVGLGTVNYVFADVGDPRIWAVCLNDETMIDGEALSYSIDPDVANITVAPSADADDDGDVDLSDYAALQCCAMATTGPLGEECEDMDLNTDEVVDARDVELFVKQITGPPPLQGDLDEDGDVDLADFAKFQICLFKFAEPRLSRFCAFVDVNRDGDVDLDDYTRLSEKLAGPQ